MKHLLGDSISTHRGRVSQEALYVFAYTLLSCIIKNQWLGHEHSIFKIKMFVTASVFRREIT